MSLQICNPQPPGRLIENDSFIARLFRLDPWQEMMLVVIRLELPGGRIKASRIVTGH